MTEGGSTPLWPVEKLTTLQLGRRLVCEVTASGPGRRAFVDIKPLSTPADRDAERQGWTRSDHARTFRVQHWDYDAALIDGFDYDVGAVLIRATTVTGESDLLAALHTWGLRPEQFRYPRLTDDPT